MFFNKNSCFEAENRKRKYKKPFELHSYYFTFKFLNPILLKDTFKHKGLRQQLVKVLIDKGINDDAVLKAISVIPRHLFMDSSFLDHAYQDKAFPIGADQTISQPYTVAFQTELLQVKKGDKILKKQWCAPRAISGDRPRERPKRGAPAFYAHEYTICAHLRRAYTRYGHTHGAQHAHVFKNAPLRRALT